MELYQLRYLRSVVRLGSVTRAAEQEHVSQPSLSKQIALLERELGVSLFHRVGRRVVATDAAALLADCAGRMLEDLAATVDAIGELRASLRGQLRLCATETVTDCVLPEALARLRQEYPGVRVSVEMLGTDDAVGRVLADELDLAIVVLPLADSRLEVRLLFEEEIRLAVPLNHAWAARNAVDLGEALAEPSLLLSMPGHGLRAQLEHEAQTRGLSLESGLELRSQQALLRLVERGAGIAFAPAGSLRDQTALAQLALRPRLTRQIGSAVRRGRRLPRAAETLLALVSTS
ncbi:MAG: LysR family transcriptional regulator [Dehalococcoidia bacterium]